MIGGEISVSILGPCLTAIRYSCSIQYSSYNMVSDTRKIFYSSSSYKNDAMLLKIMPYTRYISGDLNPISQTHPCYLTQS